MAMNYTPLPHEFLEEMEELTDEEYGRLVRWGQHYHITGEKLPLPGNERFSMKRMQMQIDRFAAAYDDKCEKARESARMRWDANASNAMRTDANNAKPKPKPNNKPISPNGDNKRGPRFAPPTLDEVKAYCEERKNGIDAQHFVDYYSRQGWMLSNGRKMKDWKATVRTWESREKKTPTVTKKSGTAYGGQPDPAVARAAYLKLCEELGEDPEATV